MSEGREKQRLLVLNAGSGQSSGMCGVFMSSRVFSLSCALIPKLLRSLPAAVIGSAVSNEQSGFPQTK